MRRATAAAQDGTLPGAGTWEGRSRRGDPDVTRLRRSDPASRPAVEIDVVPVPVVLEDVLLRVLPVMGRSRILRQVVVDREDLPGVQVGVEADVELWRAVVVGVGVRIPVPFLAARRDDVLLPLAIAPLVIQPDRDVG